MFGTKKSEMVARENALPGRDDPIPVPAKHYVRGTPMTPPFPGMETAMFAMGCFWGAEKKFWEAEGVHSSAVGYAAGYTPNPTYEEVYSGRTGHTEVVFVVYDSKVTSYDNMLKIFWESHPTALCSRRKGCSQSRCPGSAPRS